MAKSTILNTVERKSILLLGDLIIIGFSLKNFVYRAIDYVDKETLTNKMGIFFIGLFTYFMIAYVLDLYNLEKVPKSLTFSVFRVFSIAFLFTLFLFITTTIIFDFAYWRIHLFVFMAFCPIQLVLWRMLFNYIFKFVPTTKKVLYLYDQTTLDSLETNVALINGIDKETYHSVIATQLNDELTSLDNFDDHLKLKNIDTWIINTRNYNHFSGQMERKMVNSILTGKEIITYTSFYESVYEALPIQSHNDSIYEILQLKNKKLRYLQSIASFNFNLILTLFVGLFFFMVVPFVYILNLFLNKGPLFYTQLRVGKHGKEYKVFKFRSMVVDAEASGAKMATKNDARITKFGKILRKFRIDELPQILSVIRGDMLFIGPRPERKVFVDKLNEVTPFYNVRHLVKPGITGWAQVKYKYGENLEDSIRKLEYDLYYIKNKSVVLDLRIIFKTATTILFSRGV
ncbi:Sugar transferase [Croceitalea dokdonensis DOKDO 023]|uniref:Sugar transferase n=1 Tax=Croceitalea dokdonensis DOKDO 023 TaxID=1300341 RepID=A0A0P7A1B9_9FLAO|nr:sugar transferase [Croceitalea dokdonensis]KPM30199.1 Sugar transferase [Croceitalea dokdonensis DOKDO 023]